MASGTNLVDESDALLEWLPADRYRPYLSPYMSQGYKEEVSKLEQVWVAPDRIVGVVTVENPEPAADRRYHFTYLTAQIWLAQLTIIHGCWAERLPVKVGESYLRSFRIVCRRPVLQSEAVRIEVRFPERKRRGGWLVYQDAEFDIADGAFSGSKTAYVRVVADGPVPDEEGEAE